MDNFTTQQTTARLKKIRLVKEYPTIYVHEICRFCGVLSTREFDPLYPEKFYMRPMWCSECDKSSTYVMVTSLTAKQIMRDRWGFYD